MCGRLGIVQFQWCKKPFLPPLHTILLGTTNSVPPPLLPHASYSLLSLKLSLPHKPRGVFSTVIQRPKLLCFSPASVYSLVGASAVVFSSTCSHHHVHCCVPRAAVMLGDPAGGAEDTEAQIGFPKTTLLSVHRLVRFQHQTN